MLSNGSDSGSSGGGYALEIESAKWKGLYNMVYRHDTGVAPTTSTWNHIALVRDNGTTKVYKNGTQIGTSFSNTPNAPVNVFTLGAQGQNGTPTLWRYFNGLVDEARVVGAVRSADWLTAEYNNQNSPSTFYSYGSVSSSNSTYTWDYNNRLTQAVVGGVTSTYDYDQAGQRVKLSNGTTTTYYPSQYYNTDGTSVIKHITTPDGQIALATVKGTGASAAAFSVHTDHITGSNVVTNSSGALEELMDYFPYGTIRLDQKAGVFDEQRKFTGQEYDVDTGLYYYGSRYYNPAIARFASQDPMFLEVGFDLTDPQSMNSYAYARNNPLRYIDPDGEAFMDYVNGVKGYAVGFGSSFVGTIYNTVAHPIQTVKGIGNTYAEGAKAGYSLTKDMISNPSATMSQISNGLSLSYNEFESKSYYDQGKSVGNVFGTVEANIVMAKGAQSAVGAAKTGVNNYVQTVAKETNWGNPSTLLDHTVRHGPAFGTLNPRTYATKAQEFLSGSNAMKVDSSGATRAYNAQSNSFGAYSANGTTRTFFKPSERIGYWLSQVGNLVKK